MLKYISGSDSSSLLLASQNIRCRIKLAGFYDYQWDVEEVKKVIGSDISGFSKKATQYEMILDFIGSKEERAKYAELFFELTEKDLLNQTPGRLYFKDSYIECYIVGAQSGGRDERKRMVQKKVKVYAPHPFWTKDAKISIPVSSPLKVTGLTYDYAYNYEYGENACSVAFENDHFTACDFKLVAHGPFDLLTFAVNDKVYEVAISCLEKEKIILDTKKESIIKTDLYGNHWNAFGDQNFAYDNFAKIPSGSNVFSYNRNYAVELTLYQERSEPKWESVARDCGMVTHDGYYLITEDGCYLVTEEG